VQVVTRTPDVTTAHVACAHAGRRGGSGDFGGVPGPVTGTFLGEPLGKALGVPGCFTGVEVTRSSPARR
jgi:hypothetical protein